ncbi:MAG: hypothetical protein DRP63_08950, partial [Planctomycetota bacterium]
FAAVYYLYSTHSNQTKPLRIRTKSLPDATAGENYSAYLKATGGKKPYSWRLVGGTTPRGIFVETDGLVRGVPLDVDSFSLQVEVKDAEGRSKTAVVSLYVHPPSQSLQIVTTSLPEGVVGVAYGFSLSAIGGVTPYTWSDVNSVLQTYGLSLNPSTGEITGTPTQGTSAGGVTITIEVTDATNTSVRKHLTLLIYPELRIMTTSLPDATEGVAYSYTVRAAGGNAANYNWSVSGQPSWLSIDSSTGELSGTPPAASAGTYTFTVEVTDGQQTAQADLSVAVWTKLQITTTSLPDGYDGETGYSATLTATGGTGSYSWRVVSGSLPPFLSFDPSGLISGDIASNASTNSPYNFIVEVTDGQQTAQADLSITVYPQLQITTTSLPDATEGVSYSFTMSGTGGKASAYEWSASGLPSGLSIDSSTGEISGTPAIGTGGATYTVTITLTDTLQTISRTYDLVVNAGLGATLSVEDGPAAAEFGEPAINATDWVMMQIRLTASGGDVTIGGLTLAANGTGDETADITRVRIFHDTNSDGKLDANDVQIGGDYAYSADNGTIQISGLNWTITDGTSQDWIVVYDFAGTAEDTDTFTVKITEINSNAATANGLPVYSCIHATSLLKSLDCMDVAIGDVDNDGKNELIVGSTRDSHAVWVLKWNLDHWEVVWKYDSFTALGGTQPIVHVTLGDCDNDGQIEIVCDTDCGDNGSELYVFGWDGSTFGPEHKRGLPGTTRNPRNVTVGDVDNDGRNEVIASISWYGRKLVVYEWNGSQFLTSYTHNLGSDYESAEVCDTDNDGQNELLCGTSHWSDWGVRIYEWDGSTYKSVWRKQFGLSQEATVGDIDGDGKNEIVITKGEAKSSTTNCGLAVYEWDGTTYSELWSNMTSSPYVASCPIVADVLSKGRNQVIFRAADQNLTNHRVIICEWDGSSLKAVCCL